MYIQIEKNPDGSHACQYGGHLEEGWAFVPDDIILPSTFPFVNIEVAEVEHDAVIKPAIGDEPEEIIIPKYTQLEVVSMTEGEEIKVDIVFGPSIEERLAAMEEALLELMGVNLND